MNKNDILLEWDIKYSYYPSLSSLFLATGDIIFPKIPEFGRQPSWPSSSFLSEYLIFGAKIPGC